jgi:hypothetical protein
VSVAFWSTPRPGGNAEGPLPSIDVLSNGVPSVPRFDRAERTSRRPGFAVGDA